MGLPQLIHIGLSALGMGYVIANHNKPRAPWNFWATLIGSAISYSLLWWGGFFSH